MSKVLMLRVAVKQRATAAADEIFELFEKTLAELEEELRVLKEENEEQRKVLDAVLILPRKIRRKDNQQQLLESKKEVPPEPPHTNEEQVKLQTSQDGEKPQELVGGDNNPSSIAEDSGGSQHLTLHHATATKPLSCPLCDETFTHEMYLTIHMGEQHEGEQPFSCCVCEKSYATITQLSEHECVGESSQLSGEESEAADGPLPPLSDEEAPDWTETEVGDYWMEPWEPCLKAKKRSSPSSITRYACWICGKKHKRRKGLVAHMHMHASKKSTCLYCRKKFTFQPKLKIYKCRCKPLQHLRIQPEKKENLGEDVPPEPLHTNEEQEQLSVHESVGESSQQGGEGSEAADGPLPPLSDEEVPDWAETEINGHWMEPWEPQSSLKAQRRSYAPSVPRYVCWICGKKHKFRKPLIGHMRSHSVSKNTICRYCFKKFTFQPKLKTYVCKCKRLQHQRKQPEKKENPPASSSSELMQTGADADEETSDSAETGSSKPQSDLISAKPKKFDLRCNTDKKPFNSLTFGCYLCCRECVTRGNLLAHMRHHSGPLKTHCRVCKKKFELHSQRNTYTCSCDTSQLTPTTEHAGEEPFRCPVCKKSFTTVTQLDEHRSEVGAAKGSAVRMKAMGLSEAKKLLGLCSGFECKEERKTEANKKHSGESKPARKSVRIRTLRCKDAKEPFSSDSCSEHNSSRELRLFGYSYCSQEFLYNSLLMPDLSKHTGEKPFDAAFATNRSLCDPPQLHQIKTEWMETGAEGGSEAEGNSLLLHPADDSGQRKELRDTSVQTNLLKVAKQEPPHIKEEQEEQCVHQKEEQLQGPVVAEITSCAMSNG